MTDPDNYVVSIEAPDGIKHVVIPAGQVRLFTPEHGSKWRAALFLASCDLAFNDQN